ncbi:MAG: zinc-binding dehydrogenase [Rhodobacterales bacterium]|nr:zinc-binding dehydrogenase [Rhodobacterales bacterium]
MRALTFDRTRETWEGSTGMVMEQLSEPVLDEKTNGSDRSKVILRVLYSGFCGSDRGIWSRKSFGDMIDDSLDEDGGNKRIFGHEMLAEIVAVGSRVTPKYGYKPGDIVSTESHIVCGTCFQCRRGEFHVCARDKIIGISVDGCFAEYAKLPAKALWPTDINKIRPEVASIQEPFGNAVHACQVTDLRGKTVAIMGTGAIGLFAILVAKGMGAAKVIGVEPNLHHRTLATRLGCDHVLTPRRAPKHEPHIHDPDIREAIIDLTEGVGADVSLEMAGFNDSVNNAIQSTRRGGKVVLFGVRNGPAVLEDAHRVVMNGLSLHGVVGRQLFGTWEVTKALLEQSDNGIQQAIWDVMLNKGEAVYDTQDWQRDAFEDVLGKHPKAILKWADPQY